MKQKSYEGVKMQDIFEGVRIIIIHQSTAMMAERRGRPAILFKAEPVRELLLSYPTAKSITIPALIYQ